MKSNHCKLIKVSALTLATSLLVCSTPLPAAAQSPSEKEEVVYAMLDDTGEVTGIYVVNRCNGGDILDYGNYTNIRNLTTTDEFSKNGDKITASTNADMLYYQGNLEDTELPWELDIQYFLDGKACSAKDLAGASGKLKMVIKITKNSQCPDNFWKGYALQATATLDSERCSNITAPDATIANVGSNKQLSYIIMPNQGADLTITADVEDFEMDPITINCTKLNMNFDLDTQELTDTVAELQDAVLTLDDGAKELDDGAKDLSTGAKDIYDGSKTLNKGAKSLNKGVKELDKGIGTIQNALKTLNKKSKTLTSGSKETLNALTTIQSSLSGVAMDTENLSTLASASSQIKTGIDSLTAGLQSMDASINTYNQTLSASGITDINAYIEQHNQAIQALGKIPGGESLIPLLEADKAYITGSNTLIQGIDQSLDSQTGALMTGALTLQSSYQTFDTNIQSLVTSLQSLSVNMTNLQSGINSLTKNYKKLDSGIQEYTEAVNKITKGYRSISKGSTQVAAGTKELYKGTQDMADGTLQLYNGTQDLTDGTKELKDGTSEFYDETKDMDKEMTDTIDEKIDDFTGKNVEVQSFVSEKNTNVESVLFVLKTPEIKKEEPETETAKSDSSESFLDKFKNLWKNN